MARRPKKIDMSHKDRVAALKHIWTLCFLDKPEWGAREMLAEMTDLSDTLRFYDALVFKISEMAIETTQEFQTLEVSKSLEELYRSRENGNEEVVNRKIRDLAASHFPSISEVDLKALCAPLNADNIKGPSDCAKSRVALIFPKRSSRRSKMQNFSSKIARLKPKCRENLAWRGLEEPNIAPLLLFFEMSDLSIEEKRKILAFMNKEGMINDNIDFMGL